MRDFIRGLLENEKIYTYGVIPLGECMITRPYLLERSGISSGTVIIFAIPYYTGDDSGSYISAYARPRDYHAYVRMLSDRLTVALRRHFPEFRFGVFSDHSPIDERHAAASAGLGIIGKNRLLITRLYSSYVFLGEIITSANLGASAQKIGYCENCGACRAACPYGFEGGCLSALTQKKGSLTEAEEKIIKKYGSAWGCDICTEVCPHTRAAKEKNTIYSPIAFFGEKLTPRPTVGQIEAMSDEEFAERAYSWRGRETIIRNLRLLGGSCEDLTSDNEETGK